MGSITTIGWTDKTHNEWIACQKVTEEECGDCYALRWANRHGMDVWGSLYESNRHLTKTHDNPRQWNKEAQAQGKRFKVFCASLSDVFEPHPQVAEARVRLWQLIEETPFLDWQLLTKRPKFIRNLVPQSWLQTWPDHVWIGTSVGTQSAAEKRIPYVLDLPAPVNFLSCEPLVENLILDIWLKQKKINWLICGGYSGTQGRAYPLPIVVPGREALIYDADAWHVWNGRRGIVTRYSFFLLGYIRYWLSGYGNSIFTDGKL